MNRGFDCKKLSMWSLAAVLLAFDAMPTSARAQEPAVAVSAETNHRIRFDNGTIRIYEVQLAKGRSTAFHEHTKDSFSIILNTTTRANEFKNGQRSAGPVRAGQVAFASTAKGPYTHRIEATGEIPYRVLAMEILGEARAGADVSVSSRPEFFSTALQDNSRGRAYRLVLKAGESTGSFVRPANTAIIAISGGRTSETPEGKSARLWDSEPGNFRWLGASEKLSIRNESAADVEFVEIEVF